MISFIFQVVLIPEDGSNSSSSLIEGEEILGRANYFSHRLSVDSQTPLHAQNQNTLLTNSNNDKDNIDFDIISANGRSNITGSPFGFGINSNPRGKYSEHHNDELHHKSNKHYNLDT